MSSRHSYVTILPSLSTIISLKPEKEPWCAGFAPSKGRRCHCPTNARGRSSAMALLREGTKDLRAGRCIDDLLEDLAPHVLCTRWHQGQASSLVRRWQREVRMFLDTQAVSTRPERHASRSARSPSPGSTTESMEERSALLYRRLRDTMEELTLLEATLDESTIPVTPAGHRSARHASTGVNSNSFPNSSTGDTSRAVPSGRSMTRQSPRAVWRPAPDLPRVDPQVRLSRPRLATVPTVARVGSGATRRDSPGVAPQVPARAVQPVAVNRREVEGECGICLCDLQTLQEVEEEDEAEESEEEDEAEESEEEDEAEESEEEEEEEVDDDQRDSSDEEFGEDDQYEEEAQPAGEHEELTWCKARCGVNFHKHCIDQWLETAHAPTCPACRSNWRH